MEKTFEFNGNGKTIKVTYKYSQTLEDDIAYADGLNLNLGKKVVTIEHCYVDVDGKYYTQGTPVMITAENIKYRPNQVKIGMLNIGDLYLTAERADAVNAMIAECKAEGTESAATKKLAEEKAAKDAKEIKQAQAIVAEAESQKTIPTEAEYRVWRRNWNNINNEGGEGYVPTMITREQYQAAKAILNR